MRPLIRVACVSGLANRLQVLLSAFALAQATGRDLDMLWPTTTACAARFDELFATAWPVRDVPAPALAEMPFRTYRPLSPALRAAIRDPSRSFEIVTSAPLWDHLDEPLRGSVERLAKASIATLEPVPAIARRVAAFMAGQDGLRTIGVHARRGDYLVERPDVVDNEAAIIAAVDAALARWPDASVVLCSDDGAPTRLGGKGVQPTGLVGRLQARFGPKLRRHPARSLERSSPEAIEDALVDLWLLRRCEALVLSRGSLFSTMAAFGRDVPVTWCGQPSDAFRQAWEPWQRLGLEPHAVRLMRALTGQHIPAAPGADGILPTLRLAGGRALAVIPAVRHARRRRFLESIAVRRDQHP